MPFPSVQQFQSTRPRGARLRPHWHQWSSTRFNPRAHAGRDKAIPGVAGLPTLVSIHAPTRGATESFIRVPLVLAFQSTRPRGARLTRQFPTIGYSTVSIHAPTRGATSGVPPDASVTQPFQSTRPRGARLAMTGLLLARFRFNPRAHAGRDFARLRPGAIDRMFQSTRPRGARQSLLDSWGFNYRFNPRAHAGRDGYSAVKRDVDGVFQSTRPRGARQSILLGVVVPRPFQSTRPRGARHSFASSVVRVTAFQSTRPRGARPPRQISVYQPSSFQSTRPRGARPNLCLKILLFMAFQSTRPRGARPWGVDVDPVVQRVSIHAPTRGATLNQSAD